MAAAGDWKPPSHGEARLRGLKSRIGVGAGVGAGLVRLITLAWTVATEITRINRLPQTAQARAGQTATALAVWPMFTDTHSAILTLTTTSTAEPSPTSTQIPSATATRVLPPTYTYTPLPPLLSADFSQPLDTLWEIWGDPTTVALTLELNPQLMLRGADVDVGGVSSIEDQIGFESGLVIYFTTNLPPR